MCLRSGQPIAPLHWCLPCTLRSTKQSPGPSTRQRSSTIAQSRTRSLWMSLSMPRGPRVVRTTSATAMQAPMLLISCALPWLVSVPSLSRMICGCCGCAWANGRVARSNHGRTGGGRPVIKSPTGPRGRHKHHDGTLHAPHQSEQRGSMTIMPRACLCPALLQALPGPTTHHPEWQRHGWPRSGVRPSGQARCWSVAGRNEVGWPCLRGTSLEGACVWAFSRSPSHRGRSADSSLGPSAREVGWGGHQKTAVG